MTKPIIQRFRKARGWTRARLAGELGVDYSTICRWENGRVVPGRHVHLALERLAEIHPEKPVASATPEVAE